MIDRVHVLDRPPSRVRARPDRASTLDIPWLPVASLPYALLILLPLIGLTGHAIVTGGLVTALGQPLIIQSLRLSAETATLSTAVAFIIGSPVALLIARWRGPGRAFAESLIDLPIVLPPTVAGLALLITFGRRGVFGAPLAFFGIELPFTTAAVVLAQLFVAAPLFVRAATAGFASVSREVTDAAQLDGASPWQAFRHVILPLTSPVLVGGALMTWARALGEFGATIMFAGSLPGRTETMPLAIYAEFERDLDSSIGLAIVLILASAAVLVLFRSLTQQRLVEIQRAIVG